jgi:hypothetical protein
MEISMKSIFILAFVFVAFTASAEESIDPRELRSAMISSNGRWTAGEGAKCPNPLIVNAKDISSIAIKFKGKSYPSKFIKSGDDLCLMPTGKNPFPWEKFCVDGPGALATAFDAADEQKGAFERCK